MAILLYNLFLFLDREKNKKNIFISKAFINIDREPISIHEKKILLPFF